MRERNNYVSVYVSKDNIARLVRRVNTLPRENQGSGEGS